MKTVSALTIRNRLSEILEELERNGEPILVSKGRRVRAVLITPQDFKKRFLGRQTEEARREIRDRVLGLAGKRLGERDSVEVLRDLRGYG